jgi:hypothetical protein
LQLSGFRSKEWVTRKGEKRGGKILSTSTLSRILRAKIYIGKIENKKEKETFEGLHEAIIDRKLFNEVQALLDENYNRKCDTCNYDGYLLSGKIYDNNGNEFKNQKSAKSSVLKYRYYKLRGNYLPAGDVEEITGKVVENLFDNLPENILTPSQMLAFRGVDYNSLTQHEKDNLIRVMIDKIICHNNDLMYFIKIDDLTYLKAFSKKNFLSIKREENRRVQKIYLSPDEKHLVIEKGICLNYRHISSKYIGKGKRVISILENCNNLIKALSLGWRYNKMLMNGMSVNDIRKQEKTGARNIYRYLNLNNLSPNIVNDIMDSRVPSHINLQKLFEIGTEYYDFEEQEKVFYCRCL